MPAPRRPTAVLMLTGAFKKHPERARARAHEPEPTGPVGEPPKYLKAKQKRAWAELVAEAPWVTASHRSLLELMADLKVLIRDGRAVGGDKRLYMVGLSKLGITPSDNSRVQVPPKKQDENPFLRLARR